MTLHSTLCSYLEKLLWLLTGNFAKPGAQYVPTSARRHSPASAAASGQRRRTDARSPAHRIIGGLVPCNVIPDEILTDHPDRYRAMLVESGNPAHSLADSQRMREALDALELVVVIDVAMTETARLADYVLPAPSQYEKWEATFFNFEFPRNVFHLRRPLLEPLAGHAAPSPRSTPASCEALGALTDDDLAPLRAAAAEEAGRAFADAFFAAHRRQPELGALRARRALPHARPDAARRRRGRGRALGRGAPVRAGVSRRRCAGPGSTARGSSRASSCSTPSSPARRASCSPSTSTTDAGGASAADDGRMHLAIPELLDELAGARRRGAARRRPEFPFVLSAGERRSFTANTIFRDPAWRKRDAGGALRISPADAERLGVADGGRARVDDAARQREVARRGHRHDAARPRVAAQRPRPRLPGEDGAAVVTGVGAERADRQPRTATGSPARRGTSTSRRASSGSPRRQERSPMREPGAAVVVQRGMKTA